VTTLVVIAKECLPGRVKTRLHPALSYEQAAEAASAALADTLAALAGLPADRRILAFDGIVPPIGSEPYDVIPQSAGDLDERLAAVFDEVEGPTVLVGMDTPQLRPEHLAPFFPWPAARDDGTDFVFGPALDGGFWCLGMREPRGELIRGVPMSRDDTGVRQLHRLSEAGGGIRMLPPLMDVDTIFEARAVAALAPETRFAVALRSMIGAAA